MHDIGTTKERRYQELFKINKCKYFDEKENNNKNEYLGFQTTNNTGENLKILYKDAKNYYNDDADNKINLSNDIIEKIVKLLQKYSFSQSKLPVEGCEPVKNGDYQSLFFMHKFV